MTLLEKIYWLRLILGIIAALASAGFMQVVGAVSNPPQPNISFFLYGFDIALIIYIISYYVLKLKFMYNVDKPQKIFTTGIGVYFLAWLVFWVLLYTLMVSA